MYTLYLFLFIFVQSNVCTLDYCEHIDKFSHHYGRFRCLVCNKVIACKSEANMCQKCDKSIQTSKSIINQQATSETHVLTRDDSNMIGREVHSTKPAIEGI